MKYEVIINNYQKGSAFRMTPTHKAAVEKIDSRHHKVTYTDLTASEITLVEKALAKKLRRV